MDMQTAAEKAVAKKKNAYIRLLNGLKVFATAMTIFTIQVSFALFLYLPYFEAVQQKVF